MKKYLLALLCFFFSLCIHAQVYIPMAADSGATWRYRIYDIDYDTHIIDMILFLTGTDTSAYGNVYHKISSRSFSYVVPTGIDPPIVSLDANFPDLYFGAMRESGKIIYQLTGNGETEMFDFNAGIGGFIPAYSGVVQVTAIDSVLVSGTYHKRYLTTDPGYYVIEGVGSSRGLIPGINDGGSDMAFYCYTNAGVSWSPDTTIPCTYIYPIGYTSAVLITKEPVIEIYPNPANDILHISGNGQNVISRVTIFDFLGQTLWSGSMGGQLDIQVDDWPRGIYTLRAISVIGSIVIKKIVVN